MNFTKDELILQNICTQNSLDYNKKTRDMEVFYSDDHSYIGFYKNNKSISTIYAYNANIRMGFNGFENIFSQKQPSLEEHEKNVKADQNFKDSNYTKDVKRFTLSGEYLFDSETEKVFIEKLLEALDILKTRNKEEGSIPKDLKKCKRELFKKTEDTGVALFKLLKKFLKNKNTESEELELRLSGLYKIIPFRNDQYKQGLKKKVSDVLLQQYKNEITFAVKDYYEEILKEEFDETKELIDPRVVLKSNVNTSVTSTKKVLKEFNQYYETDYESLEEISEKEPNLLKSFIVKIENFKFADKVNVFLNTPLYNRDLNAKILTWSPLENVMTFNTMDYISVGFTVGYRKYTYEGKENVTLDVTCKDIVRLKKCANEDINNLLDGTQYEYKKFEKTYESVNLKYVNRNDEDFES